MLDIRTIFHKDYEKSIRFSIMRANNTILTILSWNKTRQWQNFREKTTEILYEQKKFYENLYTSKFFDINTLYEPEYEKEFIHESCDIPNLSDKDKK